MHGHIYIILKESLKHIPIIGWGMQFYGFVFMSRKMTTDQPRLAHRLNQLKEQHTGPMSGTDGLDPMWLLIFPEGTNASPNTRLNSAKWAAKLGIKDLEHTLLPRSTGSFFCLNELKGTVDYVYDCTMAYEGVPRGEFGQDLFTLRSMYLQGRRPKSVNMYWRRLAIADMPLHDAKEFDAWLLARWAEKDALIETYLTKGRFPPNEPAIEAAPKATTPPAPIPTDSFKGKPYAPFSPYIETTVRLADTWEVGNIFVVVAGTLMALNIGYKIWCFVHGTGKEFTLMTMLMQFLWPFGDLKEKYGGPEGVGRVVIPGYSAKGRPGTGSRQTAA